MIKIVILSEAKELRLFTTFRVTENMDWQVFTQSADPAGRTPAAGRVAMDGHLAGKVIESLRRVVELVERNPWLRH